MKNNRTLINKRNQPFATRKTKQELWEFLTTFMRMDERRNYFFENMGNEKILEKEFGFKILPTNLL